MSQHSRNSRAENSGSPPLRPDAAACGL